MKNWIVRWIANILAFYIVTLVVPGIKFTAHNNIDYAMLAVAVLILGFANAVIRPIIMFFAWPINCLTFGLFGFAINVIIFWIVGSGIVPGYHVNGFIPALIGSVAMGIVSGLLNFVLKDRKDRN